MNNRKAPRIRFKGFTDDWEQRKFDKVFDGLQNNTLSRADLNYESGTVKNVHYGDVLIKFGDYIEASKIDLPYISDDTKADKFKSSFLQDGDIIIADTAEDDAVGKCTEIQCSEGLKLLSGLHTIACRPKEKNGPMFLGYYINSPAYHNQLKPLMQGIKVTSISKSALQNTYMTIPKSIDEQITIGKYFSNLDHLITLHQRKLEKLKIVKKAMLENCFPKNGEKVPKFRFSGFTGDWEQRKLGEIASSFEYGLNAAAKEFDGKNKYIRITDIYDDSREFDQNNVTSPDIDLLNADSYKLTKGDILFARTGASVGKTYIYKDFDGLVYYAGFLIRAKIKDSYIPEFIFQSTLTKAYEKFIKVTSMRSGQPGVNAQEYSQFELMIPEKPEQDKIGIYFTRLDHLITLHQRKLEKLKIIKKSFLEKMFV